MRKGKASLPNHSPARTTLNQRKVDHLAACMDDSVDLANDSFASWKLRYEALPEIALEEVSTEVEFAGKKIAAPLIVSSMTGGVGAEFIRINRNLALGAAALNIPLGLGSMKVMLSHREAEVSFRVREVAPNITIIANLGLVSFNHGLRYGDIDRIIEAVEPDVFGLHLNALQEAIQEGGDTDFRGLLAHLEAIVNRCPLPVYVKECGGGIAPALVARLLEAGVAYVDVSGNDGTSWAAVEGALSSEPALGELFKDFGLPTAWILEHLPPAVTGTGKIVASGGIRNGLQAVKALALGARYACMARPFLIAAMESAEAVVEVGRRLIREMSVAMFLTGVSRVEQLDRSLFLPPPGGR